MTASLKNLRIVAQWWTLIKWKPYVETVLRCISTFSGLVYLMYCYILYIHIHIMTINQTFHLFDSLVLVPPGEDPCQCGWAPWRDTPPEEFLWYFSTYFIYVWWIFIIFKCWTLYRDIPPKMPENPCGIAITTLLRWYSLLKLFREHFCCMAIASQSVKNHPPTKARSRPVILVPTTS